MGRAERRRAEKANKKEQRKTMIHMTQEEYYEAIRQARNEATRDAFKVFATCMAVKDIRMHKYGKKRLIDNLDYMDKLMNDLLDEKADFAKYEKEVYDKGVIINCKGRGYNHE
jgi:predicted glycosyl hydrolase (DUF1957 family)